MKTKHRRAIVRRWVKKTALNYELHKFQLDETVNKRSLNDKIRKEKSIYRILNNYCKRTYIFKCVQYM